MRALILIFSILFLFNCGDNGIGGDDHHGRNDLRLEIEPNDKVSTAQAVVLPAAIHGHAHETEDTLDQYSFTVDVAANVSIALTGFSDDLDLTLHDDLGNIIQRALTDAPAVCCDETIDTITPLDPGKYIIQIEAIFTQDDISHYSLDVHQL